ncbi:DNA-J related domain-containing protein [Thiomicrorhabdus sp. ZW0627]|uniref:DNA-J related domain-containing protein n=1 Tax=Thiomicrorhabdus sp. ZW0627 TaxID=3039774 RepID=UPI002436F700|nr:DNA-J related domain-containing protein [Thiomicrorhabdus sp. ZW0627]MDG6773295.1 DNA-J related domain-containing protein [Thiomicrorhabdus sp. ZW0627]
MYGSIEVPPIPERFEALVSQALKAEPTISEYQLMKHLSANGLVEFKPDLEPLTMFRSHFLLFHLLYRLQDRWHEEGQGWLSIHTTDIHLEPDASFSPSSNPLQSQLRENDPIKSYYLDYQEFLNTQKEDVLGLLDDFWRRMAGLPALSIDATSRSEAMKTLGLEEESLSLQSVKQQFRTLCQQHHPDKGGDPKMFRRICDAKDILAMSLKSP